MGDRGHNVGQLVALSRDASMSSSYKPALLKALVRIARDASSQQIPLSTIGDHFVRLYWVQTVVFHLRQAATLVKEPKVVQAIRQAAEVYKIRRLSELPRAERDRLARTMAQILKINVLRAFHQSMPAAMPQLFTWDGKADSIMLTPEAFAFLKRDGVAIESLSNLWWARYLEGVNVLAPHVIAKVERDGAQRSSLARYLRLLQEIDEHECFYCGTPLSDKTQIHVDHVIPWSFILMDPPWDLVLACQPCNIAKSDVLPVRDYLAKLVGIHERRARAQLPPGYSASYLPESELFRFYDAALSVEWPTGWSPPSP